MAEAIPLPFIDDKDDTFYTSIIKENLRERVLILNEEITDDIVERMTMQIIAWNREDKGKPENERKPIRMYINSPGGDVFVSLALIDVIRNSKTKVIGVGVGLVASAAYYIYLGCHERYAFKNSILLMHDGELSVSNSTSKARDTLRFFNSLDVRIKEFVLDRTNIDEAFYDDHYEQEYYMFPDEAKALGVVHGIIGEDIELDEVL